MISNYVIILPARSIFLNWILQKESIHDELETRGKKPGPFPEVAGEAPLWRTQGAGVLGV